MRPRGRKKANSNGAPQNDTKMLQTNTQKQESLLVQRSSGIPLNAKASEIKQCRVRLRRLAVATVNDICDSEMTKIQTEDEDKEKCSKESATAMSTKSTNKIERKVTPIMSPVKTRKKVVQLPACLLKRGRAQKSLSKKVEKEAESQNTTTKTPLKIVAALSPVKTRKMRVKTKKISPKGDIARNSQQKLLQSKSAYRSKLKATPVPSPVRTRRGAAKLQIRESGKKSQTKKSKAVVESSSEKNVLKTIQKTNQANTPQMAVESQPPVSKANDLSASCSTSASLKTKPISKLALTRRKAIELKLKGSTLSQTENSTSEFSSNINSKAATETEPRTPVCAAKQTTKQNSTSVQKAISPRNLANKPNIISDILLSDDVELECENVDIGTAENVLSMHSTKSHKFFHRSDVETKLKAVTVETEQTKHKKKCINKKQTGTRVSHKISNGRNVYDFLSQSQTSDSDNGKHKDPTADIVKKLIEEGKVAVTKYRKGKPVTIRKAPRKRKINIRDDKKPLKKAIEHEQVLPIVGERDENDNFDVNFDDDGNLNRNAEMPEDLPTNAITASTSKQAATNKEGTFSNMARSILKQQQTERTNSHTKFQNKQRLLDIARKFVSTPVKPQRDQQIPMTANFSPIPHPMNASPWRISNEAALPTTFNFSSNSAILPSFSSDYIPPSPKKNRSNELSLVSNSNLMCIKSLEIAHASQPSDIQQTVISSYSSNDSNAENLTPPAAQSILNQLPTEESFTNIENAEIFNSRQIPNPRRTLTHRSPLKPINILSVVTLPPWKEITGIKEKSTATPNQSQETEKFFGFEEFLDDDSETNEMQTSLKDNNKSMSRGAVKKHNRSLHKQLKNLRKWRPNVVYNQDTKATKHVFEDDFDKRHKNRNIKEMLCSTMINAASTKTTLNKALSTDSSDDSVSEKAQKEVDDLFGDPVTHFDQKSIVRTYERPMRRKRKLQHQFSVLYESDECSDEEEHHGKAAQTDALNTSETAAEGAKHKQETKKRHHRDAKPDTELDKFMTEFNSMCEEVDKYELLVE